MVHRVSLGPPVPKDSLEKNRRKSANARLTNDPIHSSTLGTEPYKEKGSSLETPFIIDSDDEKDDKTTPRSRSGPETPPTALKARTGVGLSACLKQPNFSIPSSTASPEHSEQTSTRKYESSPRTGTQKLRALCGMSYVKPGNLRNHQDGCSKCKAIHDKENDPSNDQKELSDRIRQLSTSPPRASGANKLLDRSFRYDNMRGKDSETNDNQKEIMRANNSNTTQLVTWYLSDIATKEILPSDEEGFVYILHDPETGFLKIGRAKDPKKRANQHEKCGRNLETIHISQRVTWVKRAEKLILSDLQHLRKPWHCSSCRQSHGEYFEVTVERAKSIVARWVEWINRRGPYQSDRNITSLWKYLIHYGRLPTKEIEAHDHEARWTHWDWVLSEPSESEIESHIKRSATGRKEEKTSEKRYFRDGATYITPRTLDATDENDLMDPAAAEILDGAAVALVGKLRGSKDCVTMTFRVESSSGEALVYSTHWCVNGRA
ncbi:hypothetical protein yc1106_09564 [Curvularia clavata]|uniref:Bacteriophage T5 Orf172 DNA-binding domain-containing protein n=1 Tax=Curvularia clavata TaxID=95742 RepID=A0A9Q8ZHH5_CURCL|nr:hypothetical protein yc1106_09564 [Curvularia clavata]